MNFQDVKLVSKKVDKYKREVLIFEITRNDFVTLQTLKEKIARLMGIDETGVLFVPWFSNCVEENIDAELADMIDSRCMLKFTKTSCDVNNVTVGKKYNIVSNMKYYDMTDKKGISSNLQSVVEL